jgi:hypothetical protein
MIKGKDKYLGKVAAARAKAERAGSEELEVAWLEVAEAWMELAVRRKPSTAEQSFEDRADSEGTGQTISARSQ